MKLQKFQQNLNEIRGDTAAIPDPETLVLKCNQFYQALFECLKSDGSLSGEEKIVALTSTLDVFCYLRPQCDVTDQRADALGHFIFMECSRLVLDISFIQLEDNEGPKAAFQASLARCVASLQALPVMGPMYSLLQWVMTNQWNHPTLVAMMNGEDVDQETAMSYLQTGEYPELFKLRVEMLVQDGCEPLALNLCSWMVKAPVFENDPGVRQSQLLLMHRLDKHEDFHTLCVELRCCQAVQVLQQMVTKARPDEKHILLTMAQTFLIQDWMKPNSYCCTKTLLAEWLGREREQEQDNTTFVNSVTKIGLLAQNSQQHKILLECMLTKFQSEFLQLCTEIAIKAMRLDRHRLDSARTYTKDEKETEAAATSLAQLCHYISKLYNHHLQMKLACLVAAFYLDPKEEVFFQVEGIMSKMSEPVKNKAEAANGVEEENYAELLEMVDTLRPAKFDPRQGWEQVKKAMITHLEEAGFKYNPQTNQFANLSVLREKARLKLEQAKTKQQQQILAQKAKHEAHIQAVKAKQAAQAQAAKAKAEKKANRAEQKKTVLTGANVKWEIKQPGHIVSKGAPMVKDNQHSQGGGRLAQGIKHIQLKDSRKQQQQQQQQQAKAMQVDSKQSLSAVRSPDTLHIGQQQQQQQLQVAASKQKPRPAILSPGAGRQAQTQQAKTYAPQIVSPTGQVPAKQQPKQLLSPQAKYQMLQQAAYKQGMLSPTNRQQQHQQFPKQQQQQLQQAGQAHGSATSTASSFPPYTAASQSMLGVTLDEIQQVLSSGSHTTAQGTAASSKTPMDEGALKKITDFLQDGLAKGSSTDKGIVVNQQPSMAAMAKRQQHTGVPRVKSPVAARSVNPRGPMAHHCDGSSPLDLSASSHQQTVKSPGGSSYALDLSKGTLHTILTTSTASQASSFTPTQMTTAARQQQQQQLKVEPSPQHQSQVHLVQQQSPTVGGLQPQQGSPPKTLVGNFVGTSTVPLANTVTITEAIPLYAMEPQKSQLLAATQTVTGFQQAQLPQQQQQQQLQQTSLNLTNAVQVQQTIAPTTQLQPTTTVTLNQQSQNPPQQQQQQPTQPLSVKLPTGQVLNLQVLNVPVNTQQVQQVLAGQATQLQSPTGQQQQTYQQQLTQQVAAGPQVVSTVQQVTAQTASSSIAEQLRQLRAKGQEIHQRQIRNILKQQQKTIKQQKQDALKEKQQQIQQKHFKQMHIQKLLLNQQKQLLQQGRVNAAAAAAAGGSNLRLVTVKSEPTIPQAAAVVTGAAAPMRPSVVLNLSTQGAQMVQAATAIPTIRQAVPRPTGQPAIAPAPIRTNTPQTALVTSNSAIAMQQQRLQQQQQPQAVVQTVTANLGGSASGGVLMQQSPAGFLPAPRVATLPLATSSPRPIHLQPLTTTTGITTTAHMAVTTGSNVMCTNPVAAAVSTDAGQQVSGSKVVMSEHTYSQLSVQTTNEGQEIKFLLTPNTAMNAKTSQLCQTTVNAPGQTGIQKKELVENILKSSSSAEVKALETGSKDGSHKAEPPVMVKCTLEDMISGVVETTMMSDSGAETGCDGSASTASCQPGMVPYTNRPPKVVAKSLADYDVPPVQRRLDVLQSSPKSSPPCSTAATALGDPLPAHTEACKPTGQSSSEAMDSSSGLGAAETETDVDGQPSATETDMEADDSELTAEGFTCKYCNESFSSMALRHKHQEWMCKAKQDDLEMSSASPSHHSQGMPAYFCEVCTKEFDDAESLQTHTVKAHGQFVGPEESSTPEHGHFYICEICGKTTETKRGRKLHMVRMHGFNFELEEIRSLGIRPTQSQSRRRTMSDSVETTESKEQETKKQEKSSAESDSHNEDVEDQDTGESTIDYDPEENKDEATEVHPKPKESEASDGKVESDTESNATEIYEAEELPEQGNTSQSMPEDTGSTNRESTLKTPVAAITVSTASPDKVESCQDPVPSSPQTATSERTGENTSKSANERSSIEAKESNHKSLTPQNNTSKTSKSLGDSNNSLLANKLSKALDLEIGKRQFSPVRLGTRRNKSYSALEDESVAYNLPDGVSLKTCSVKLRHLSDSVSSQMRNCSVKLRRLSNADIGRFRPIDKAQDQDDVEELPDWLSKKLELGDEQVHTLADIPDDEDASCMCDLCGELLTKLTLKDHACKELKLNMSPLKDIPVTISPLSSSPLTLPDMLPAPASADSSMEADVSSVDSCIDEPQVEEQSVEASRKGCKGKKEAPKLKAGEDQKENLEVENVEEHKEKSPKHQLITMEQQSTEKPKPEQTAPISSPANHLPKEASPLPPCSKPSIKDRSPSEASMQAANSTPSRASSSSPGSSAGSREALALLEEGQNSDLSYNRRLIDWNGAQMYEMTKYLCSKCYRTFQSTEECQTHQADGQHPPAKVIEYNVYQCKYCDNHYQSKDSMQKHILFRCKKKPAVEDALASLDPLKCFLCRKDFLSSTVLEHHLISKHKVKNPGKAIEEIQAAAQKKQEQATSSPVKARQPTKAKAAGSPVTPLSPATSQAKTGDTAEMTAVSGLMQLSQGIVPIEDNINPMGNVSMSKEFEDLVQYVSENLELGPALEEAAPSLPEVEDNRETFNELLDAVTWHDIDLPPSTAIAESTESNKVNKASATSGDKTPSSSTSTRSSKKISSFWNVTMYSHNKAFVRCKTCSERVRNKPKRLEKHGEGACGPEFPMQICLGFSCPYCLTMHPSKKLCAKHQFSECLKYMGFNVEQIRQPHIACPKCEHNVYDSCEMAAHLRIKHSLTKEQISSCIKALKMSDIMNEHGKPPLTKQQEILIDQVLESVVNEPKPLQFTPTFRKKVPKSKEAFIFKNVLMTSFHQHKCEMCGLSMKLKDVSAHRLGPCWAKAPNSDFISKHQSFVCPHCKEAFPSRPDCREHQLATCLRNAGYNIPVLEKPQLVCPQPQCRKRLWDTSFLSRHLVAKHQCGHDQAKAIAEQFKASNSMTELLEEKLQHSLSATFVPQKATKKGSTDSKGVMSPSSPPLSSQESPRRRYAEDKELTALLYEGTKTKSRTRATGVVYRNVIMSCQWMEQCKKCESLLAPTELKEHWEGPCGRGEHCRQYTYSCPHCKAVYRTKKDCWQHQIDNCLQQAGLDIELLSQPQQLCPICDEKFFTNSQLVHHCKNKHHLQKEKVRDFVTSMNCKDPQMTIKALEKLHFVDPTSPSTLSSSDDEAAESAPSMVHNQGTSSHGQSEPPMLNNLPTTPSTVNYQVSQTAVSDQTAMPTLSEGLAQSMGNDHPAELNKKDSIMSKEKPNGDPTEDENDVQETSEEAIGEAPPTPGTQDSDEARPSHLKSKGILYKNILMLSEWKVNCKTCFVTLDTRTDRKKHQNTSCGEDYPIFRAYTYACPYCQKSFKSKSDCRDHQLNVCLKKRGYDTQIIKRPQLQCPVMDCDVRVYDGTHLKNHLRMTHHVGKDQIQEILDEMVARGILGENMEAQVWEDPTDLEEEEEENLLSMDMNLPEPECDNVTTETSETDTQEAMDVKLNEQQASNTEPEQCTPAQLAARLDQPSTSLDKGSQLENTGVAGQPEQHHAMNLSMNVKPLINPEADKGTTSEPSSPSKAQKNYSRSWNLKGSVYNNVTMFSEWVPACKKCETVLSNIEGPCCDDFERTRLIIFYCPHCNEQFRSRKACCQHQLDKCLKEKGVDIKQLSEPHIKCPHCETRVFDFLRLYTHLKKLHRLPKQEIVAIIKFMKKDGVLQKVTNILGTWQAPRDIIANSALKEGASSEKKKAEVRADKTEEQPKPRPEKPPAVDSPVRQSSSGDTPQEVVYRNVVMWSQGVSECNSCRATLYSKEEQAEHSSGSCTKGEGYIRYYAYQCPYCKADFSSKKTCFSHLHNQCLKDRGVDLKCLAKPRLFCPICGAIAFDPTFLRAHLRKNHQLDKKIWGEITKEMDLEPEKWLQTQKAIIDADQTASVSLIFQCNQCETVTTSSKLLAYHKKYLCRKTLEERRRMWEEEDHSKPHICTLCSVSFTHHISMIFHTYGHDTADLNNRSSQSAEDGKEGDDVMDENGGDDDCDIADQPSEESISQEVIISNGTIQVYKATDKSHLEVTITDDHGNEEQLPQNISVMDQDNAKGRDSNTRSISESTDTAESGCSRLDVSTQTDQESVDGDNPQDISAESETPFVLSNSDDDESFEGFKEEGAVVVSRESSADNSRSAMEPPLEEQPVIENESPVVYSTEESHANMQFHDSGTYVVGPSIHSDKMEAQVQTTMQQSKELETPLVDRNILSNSISTTNTERCEEKDDQANDVEPPKELPPTESPPLLPESTPQTNFSARQDTTVPESNMMEDSDPTETSHQNNIEMVEPTKSDQFVEDDTTISEEGQGGEMVETTENIQQEDSQNEGVLMDAGPAADVSGENQQVTTVNQDNQQKTVGEESTTASKVPPGKQAFPDHAPPSTSEMGEELAEEPKQESTATVALTEPTLADNDLEESTSPTSPPLDGSEVVSSGSKTGAAGKEHSGQETIGAQTEAGICQEAEPPLEQGAAVENNTCTRLEDEQVHADNQIKDTEDDIRLTDDIGLTVKEVSKDGRRDGMIENGIDNEVGNEMEKENETQPKLLQHKEDESNEDTSAVECADENLHHSPVLRSKPTTKSLVEDKDEAEAENLIVAKAIAEEDLAEQATLRRQSLRGARQKSPIVIDLTLETKETEMRPITKTSSNQINSPLQTRKNGNRKTPKVLAKGRTTRLRTNAAAASPPKKNVTLVKRLRSSAGEEPPVIHKLRNADSPSKQSASRSAAKLLSKAKLAPKTDLQKSKRKKRVLSGLDMIPKKKSRRDIHDKEAENLQVTKADTADEEEEFKADDSTKAKDMIDHTYPTRGKHQQSTNTGHSKKTTDELTVQRKLRSEAPSKHKVNETKVDKTISKKGKQKIQRGRPQTSKRELLGSTKSSQVLRERRVLRSRIRKSPIRSSFHTARVQKLKNQAQSKVNLRQRLDPNNKAKATKVLGQTAIILVPKRKKSKEIKMAKTPKSTESKSDKEPVVVAIQNHETPVVPQCSPSEPTKVSDVIDQKVVEPPQEGPEGCDKSGPIEESPAVLNAIQDNTAGSGLSQELKVEENNPADVSVGVPVDSVNSGAQGPVAPSGVLPVSDGEAMSVVIPHVKEPTLEAPCKDGQHSEVVVAEQKDPVTETVQVETSLPATTMAPPPHVVTLVQQSQGEGVLPVTHALLVQPVFVLSKTTETPNPEAKLGPEGQTPAREGTRSPDSVESSSSEGEADLSKHLVKSPEKKFACIHCEKETTFSTEYSFRSHLLWVHRIRTTREKREGSKLLQCLLCKQQPQNFDTEASLQCHMKWVHGVRNFQASRVTPARKECGPGKGKDTSLSNEVIESCTKELVVEPDGVEGTTKGVRAEDETIVSLAKNNAEMPKTMDKPTPTSSSSVVTGQKVSQEGQKVNIVTSNRETVNKSLVTKTFVAKPAPVDKQTSQTASTKHLLNTKMPPRVIKVKGAKQNKIDLQPTKPSTETIDIIDLQPTKPSAETIDIELDEFSLRSVEETLVVSEALDSSMEEKPDNKDEPRKEALSVPSKKSKSPMLKCHLCQTEFMRQFQLDRHMKIVHNAVFKPKVASNKGWNCLCGANLSSYQDYLIHAKKSHGNDVQEMHKQKAPLEPFKETEPRPIPKRGKTTETSVMVIDAKDARPVVSGPSQTTSMDAPSINTTVSDIATHSQGSDSKLPANSTASSSKQPHQQPSGGVGQKIEIYLNEAVLCGKPKVITGTIPLQTKSIKLVYKNASQVKEVPSKVPTTSAALWEKVTGKSAPERRTYSRKRPASALEQARPEAPTPPPCTAGSTTPGTVGQGTTVIKLVPSKSLGSTNPPPSTSGMIRILTPAGTNKSLPAKSSASVSAPAPATANKLATAPKPQEPAAKCGVEVAVKGQEKSSNSSHREEVKLPVPATQSATKTSTIAKGRPKIVRPKTSISTQTQTLDSSPVKASTAMTTSTSVDTPNHRQPITSCSSSQGRRRSIVPVDEDISFVKDIESPLSVDTNEDTPRTRMLHSRSREPSVDSDTSVGSSGCRSLRAVPARQAAEAEKRRTRSVSSSVSSLGGSPQLSPAIPASNTNSKDPRGNLKIDLRGAISALETEYTTQAKEKPEEDNDSHAPMTTRRKHRLSMDSAATTSSDGNSSALSERLTRSGKHQQPDPKPSNKSRPQHCRSSSMSSLDKRSTRGSTSHRLPNIKQNSSLKSTLPPALRKLLIHNSKEPYMPSTLDHGESKRLRRHVANNPTPVKDGKGSSSSSSSSVTKRKAEASIAEAKYKLKKLKMSSQRVHVRSSTGIRGKPAKAHGYRTRTNTS